MTGNRTYYLIFLPPLIIIPILCELLNLSFFGLTIFIVAYSWRAIFIHPNLTTKVNEYKNRFSFTKWIYLYETKFISTLLSIKKIKIPLLLIKISSPVIPILILSIISRNYYLIIWGILGGLLAEAINLIHLRYKSVS